MPALPPLVQNHLLRIAREAVHNAIKYSQAKEIDVSLEQTDGALKLEVTDDGAGFDVAEAGTLEGRFGIRGMRERAKKTGGATGDSQRARQGHATGLHPPHFGGHSVTEPGVI